MADRRRFLLSCAALATVSGVGGLVHQLLAASNETGGQGAVTVDLKEQLEKGLKARRPSEFRFIARVLQLVDQEVLPRSLVESTFVWARKKPARKMQYFEFALRTRARRLGVRI